MNDDLRIFHARGVETFVKNVQQLQYFEDMAREYAGKDSQKHGFFIGEAAKLKDSIFKCAPWVALSLNKCFPELKNTDEKNGTAHLVSNSGGADGLPGFPPAQFVEDFNC